MSHQAESLPECEVSYRTAHQIAFHVVYLAEGFIFGLAYLRYRSAR